MKKQFLFLRYKWFRLFSGKKLAQKTATKNLQDDSKGEKLRFKKLFICKETLAPYKLSYYETFTLVETYKSKMQVSRQVKLYIPPTCREKELYTAAEVEKGYEDAIFSYELHRGIFMVSAEIPKMLVDQGVSRNEWRSAIIEYGFWDVRGRFSDVRLTYKEYCTILELFVKDNA